MLFCVLTGCGVNVCNRYPTMSINDCIQLYNNERGVSLPLFTVEALMALVLNRLERYLCLFESDGMASFESDYYSYWVHRWVLMYSGTSLESRHLTRQTYNWSARTTHGCHNWSP